MKKFVIIASQRTGSNMLASTLRSHSDIDCHGELFRRKKKHLRGGVRIFAEIDPRFQQWDYLQQHWRELLDLLVERGEQAGVQAVGFKLMAQQCNAVRDALIEDDSWIKIVLKRDNLLAVYSSDKIAKLVARGGIRRLFRSKKPRVKFVEDEFTRFCSQYERRFDTVNALLREHGQSFLDIRYSQICGPQGIRQVIDYLGFDPDAEWKVRAQKRNSSRLLDRFSNPWEVAAHMKKIGREEWLVE